MAPRDWLLVTALILGHFSLAVIFPALSWIGQENELVDAMLIGWCIGQLNLIAAWSALAPGKLVVRVPWSLLLATFLWYALVVGVRALPASHGFGQNARLLGALLLCGVLATQVPLWVARLGYQWRLLPPAAAPERTSGPDDQFSIRQLLLGIVALALALGVGRRALLSAASWPDVPVLSEMLLVLLVAAVCNWVLSTPCIWMAFVPEAMVAAGLIGWVIYALVVSIVEVMTLTMLLGPPPTGGDIILVAWLFNLAQSAAVFGTMILLRAAGFRMTRMIHDVANES